MNSDDLKGLNQATREEIEELQKVTREKDGDNNFSEAQAIIGELLIKENKTKEAIDAWFQVKRSDNKELYTKLQVNIGIAFNELGNIENALQSWSNVVRSDNNEIYAYAKFYTGSMLHELNKDTEAIEAYKSIEYEDTLDIFIEAQFRIGNILFRRNEIEGAVKILRNIKFSDNSLAYAKAQFNIGSMLLEKNIDENQGLKAWRNIKRSYDPKIFADAQFGIGYELQIRGETTEALRIWSQIERSDNPEVYAKAQFNVGAILRKQGDKEYALSAWRNIKYSDDVQSFVKAKFSIGIILSEDNRTDEALAEWLCVNRKDDKSMFAQAQFNIGCTLSDKNDIQGALLAWNTIKRSDDSETYAKAKIKIGFILDKRQNYEEAITEWSNIERSDNPEAYAVAQANIGYLSFHTPKVAKKAFLNIQKNDDPRIYAHAQFKLGLIFIDEYNIEEAKKSFDVAKSYYPYESYCYEEICELLKVPETEGFGLSSLKLLNVVLDIIDILTLDFSKYADEEKPFERKLAHYTSTYTSNLLLGNDKKNSHPSLFRLNTINNVNDPSEGQLLIRKLKGVKDNNFIPLDFDENFHAFISCFTFNHDSLNQFRLYGKQDNKEASGMSLVFKKEFFQSKNFIGGISYLSFEKASKVTEAITKIDNKEFHEINFRKSENEDEDIVKRSVMRCMYLDPTSDYFHLAQRNRLTFFREFGDKTIIKDGITHSQAEYEWSIYQNYIEIITKDFKEAYGNLKATYKKVEAEINNVRFSVLVDAILLPLKYLIKHSAFREEQECRMIYITSVDKPEVTMEYGSLLYVEYEPNVKDYLDKIYIAPAALHHKRYFDHILKDVDVPVEVSGNVFR